MYCPEELIDKTSLINEGVVKETPVGDQ